MSDYKFLYNPAINQSFSGTVSNGVITLGSGSFDEGDVIYIPVSDTVGVYAYCTDETARTFQFDDEVYENVPSSVSTTTGLYLEIGDVIYDDVTSYRMLAAVNKAVFSETYEVYNTSIDYRLAVSVKRREFFTDTTNKSVRSLLLADRLIFIDTCKEVAYRVAFQDDEFDFFNNKFKSSLAFNIAKR